jgi:hypothetical protein
MKWETILLLILWSLTVLDSGFALVCKFIPGCQTMVERIPLTKSFGLDSPWVYVYFLLAVLGLVTVLVMRPKPEGYQGSHPPVDRKPPNHPEQRRYTEPPVRLYD